MAAAAGAAAARGAASGSAARAGKSGKGSARAGKADKSAPPTESDRKALKARAAAGDALLQGAYEAGQEGTAWEDLAEEVQEEPGAADAYQTGLDERAAGRRDAVVSGARSAAGTAGAGVGRVAGVRGPGLVNDTAGFVLGLLLYALTLNYLQGGSAQVRGWLRAKFLNQPYGPSATATLATKFGRKVAATAKAEAKAS